MLSDPQAQLLSDAFTHATRALPAEKKLAFLFAHALRAPAQQRAERVEWVAQLQRDQADVLEKLDANVAAAKEKAQRLLAELQALRDALTPDATP